MKKIIAVSFIAVSLAACNDGSTDNATVNSDTSTTTTTTTTMDTGTATMNMDTAANSNSTATTYTPAEGDVSYRSKKVQVYRNRDWVDTDEDVRLDNDVVVSRRGRVRQGEREVELREGEVVNRSGRFFDKTGNAIGNVWDDTKRGVKKAGKAVGNAAKKVGDKVEDAVTDDDKK